MARIGVIGGSGFYRIEGLEEVTHHVVNTPYGQPSAPIVECRSGGDQVFFLARHGLQHRYNPTHVPYQANIYALKSLGVTHIISVSAVGSLKQEIEPLHFVVPDQIIDRTRSRANTFFDPIAVHAGFAEPFCREMRPILVAEARRQGLTVHDGGTYVCMEGPLFSTKAESEMHRGGGASVIGMTVLPEAKLAREAEIAYGQIALATDYDVWHEEEVTVEAVVARLLKNVENVKNLLKAAIPRVAGLGPCSCHSALKNALLSDPRAIPEEKKEAFRLFLGKYIDLG